MQEYSDNYEVEIYDYSADTSFTDVYELLAYDFVNDGLFGEVPTELEITKMAKEYMGLYTLENLYLYVFSVNNVEYR